MFTSENAAEMNAKRKHYRGGAQASAEKHLPTNAGKTISTILANLCYWDDAPKVETNEECADRLTDFFARCQETGELPTVEKMAIALRITRTTLMQWERGDLGEERAELIGLAKERIHALEGEMVMEGKIPAVPYIFRSKNYYGMADKQEVEVKVEEPEVEEVIDLDAIAKEYKQYLPPVTEAKAIETTKNT